MKAITCTKCKKKIKGDGTFDEVAEKHGFTKRGDFYTCPDCEKPPAKKTNRVSNFVKRGKEDDEQAFSQYID